MYILNSYTKNKVSVSPVCQYIFTQQFIIEFLLNNAIVKCQKCQRIDSNNLFVNEYIAMKSKYARQI